MLKKTRSTHSEYFYCDIAALALGVFLFAAFWLTAKNGVSAPDESFYFTVTQRLFLGEKLIADEWNIAQLVHLLNVIPYYAFTRVTGGTEGIILFMRYVFISVNTVFYSWVYVKLRRYRFWGVACAFSFCAVILQTIMSITYFTSAPMAILAFCLILMTDEKKKNVFVLVFAGVLLACAVLAEPYLIAAFILWFFAVAIRAILEKKKPGLLKEYGFVLDIKVFVPVTVGAVAVFVPFMLYMTLGGSFENFIKAFPYLASGAEVGKLGSVLFKKTADGAVFFGLPFVLCEAAVLAAACVFRIKKSKNKKARLSLFISACALLAATYVYAGIKTAATKELSVWVAYTEYHGFSFLLFAPVPFLLSEKKQPRLTAFLICGMAFNLLVDASSAVILGSGAGLVTVACILKLPEFLPELFKEENKKGKSGSGAQTSPALKKAAVAAFAVLTAATVLWHGSYIACETVYKPVEKLFRHVDGPLTSEIEKGPFKGLKTTPEIENVYLMTLEDLDCIKERANGKPIAVLELSPYTYLYAGLPYGSYTAWFEFYETDRLAAFWALRPKQEAAYIYIPFYENGLLDRYPDDVLQKKLEFLEPYVLGKTETGKAGYIIEVEKTILPELG
ncbi:MAG: hypothetical protein IJS90_04115 [Clostridia bacterium]|nr:hypothetical protein [Clostridia bacterium]